MISTFPNFGAKLLSTLFNFNAEMLSTFPKSAQVKAALLALHDSIIWVNVSTGPEACEHVATREKMYKLLAEREELKQADLDRNGSKKGSPAKQYAEDKAAGLSVTRLQVI
jgi:hypothetical protein